MGFASLLHSLREQQVLRGFRRKTQQLDDQTRNHLQEFLEDVPAEQEELQRVQQELEQAQAKQQQLQEKERFVEIRLKRYREHLQKYESQQHLKHEQQTTKDETSEDAPQEAAGENETDIVKEKDDSDTTYEKHMEALHQIEASHKTMQRGLEVLQEKIDVLEARQLELVQLTEECQVVYETAQAIQSLQLETATEDDVVLGGEHAAGVDAEVEEANCETVTMEKDANSKSIKENQVAVPPTVEKL